MKKKRTSVPDQELQDRLATHLRQGGKLMDESSPIRQLMQNTINSILEGELDAHLEEEKAAGRLNKRNGYISKRGISEYGELNIKTPRDRLSTFEPQIIPKRQREVFTGIEDQVLALYAQGNSVEDTKRLLKRLIGLDVSAGKISMITDRILPLVEEWRRRPLASFYAVIYLDAIHFKVRREGTYTSQAFYTLYGIDANGERDILGLYLAPSEGAYQWGLTLEDIKSRGVDDVLVFCTDNLTGFTAAIDAVFPASIIQKCIVHQVRNSVRFVNDKDRRMICKDLRKVYTAINREEALVALENLYQKWPKQLHRILDDWKSKWDELFAFMDFPPEMRRIIYTTNPVEAVHRIMRKLIKSKAAWSSETGLLKQLYLSLTYNEKSWKRKVFAWKTILSDIVQRYGDRVEKHIRL